MKSYLQFCQESSAFAHPPPISPAEEHASAIEHLGGIVDHPLYKKHFAGATIHHSYRNHGPMSVIDDTGQRYIHNAIEPIATTVESPTHKLTLNKLDHDGGISVSVTRKGPNGTARTVPVIAHGTFRPQTRSQAFDNAMKTLDSK